MIAPTHETHSLSRKLEFFAEGELNKQIGYPIDLLRELLAQHGKGGGSE